MLKRSLDLLLAAVGLLVLCPLLVLLWAWIRFRVGRPVFFRQTRPGKNAKPFEIVKFRTMNDAVDAEGELLPDEARLTKLGSCLRKTSLDELPELWNVLKGEMSFVGPRPLLMEYLDLYDERQARRHEVSPGITGWAQINGRNQLNWEDKFELDVWYVENQTLWLDLKILVLTAWKVICREGITYDGEATMSKFTGSKVPSEGECSG